MPQLLLWDGFSPGTSLGSTSETIDDALAGQWRAVYGAAPGGPHDGTLPHALVQVLVMRAFLRVVAPRPPGNVHAGIELTIERSPQPGDTVTTALECVGKSLRKGRRFVDLGFATTCARGPLARGRLTLIWSR